MFTPLTHRVPLRGLGWMPDFPLPEIPQFDLEPAPFFPPLAPAPAGEAEPAAPPPAAPALPEAPIPPYLYPVDTRPAQEAPAQEPAKPEAPAAPPTTGVSPIVVGGLVAVALIAVVAFLKP